MYPILQNWICIFFQHIFVLNGLFNPIFFILRNHPFLVNPVVFKWLVWCTSISDTRDKEPVCQILIRTLRHLRQEVPVPQQSPNRQTLCRLIGILRLITVARIMIAKWSAVLGSQLVQCSKYRLPILSRYLIAEKKCLEVPSNSQNFNLFHHTKICLRIETIKYYWCESSL